MALISPGVQVSIIDESNYTPAAAGTVPLVVVASAQNKTTTSGAVAEYTTAANAGKVFLVTSQRELITKYGKPNFLVSQGTPVHGYELNEYGLLAAYSALGVSNAAYIIRADVDLNQLASSLTRPSGAVANNTLWLDTDSTSFGIFQWNSLTGFSAIKPTGVAGAQLLYTITDPAYISANKPIASLGKPGDYAIDATDVTNPVFYKIASPSPDAGTWVVVGSTDWLSAWPAVVGSTVSNGAVNPLTQNDQFTINGADTITIADTDWGATEVAAAINAATIPGVTAAATSDNRLAIYNTDTNTPLSFSEDTGTPLQDLGIDPSKTYACPAFQASKHTQVPSWGANDANPRPTGSVWFKTSAPNNGANFVVKRYNRTSNTWTTLTTPIYSTDAAAIYGLDSTGGGLNIAAGKTYIQSDVHEDNTFTFKLYNRKAGVTKVTGSVTSITFAGGSKTFSVAHTSPGSGAMSSPATNVTFSGTTAADFVAALNNANIPYVSAGIETSGAISIVHATGGVIELANVVGNPLTTIGITDTTAGVRESDATAGTLVLSNWLEVIYTVSGNTPVADPADGTYWYYNSPTEFDIMINDGTGWKGYHNVIADSRGYDLSQTSPNGPIASASEPIAQSDGTGLVSGDLWVDTGNFEDFPKIYRYNATLMKWILVDVTDQTTSDGVLFADARWGGSDDIDIVVDDIPTIKSLLTSDYTDLDCPSYALYPRGTLLFNTRRSGLNVKEFVVNHFADYEPTPAYLNAWVNASGLDSNGVAYLGRKAQRNLVVSKMAAAVSNSVEATEETRNFNLIVAPGYPELTSTLNQLNVNRKETAFVLVDSPMRLESDSNTLDAWSRNLNLATEDSEKGFVSYYEYMAGYYPSGYSRDLDGYNAVVPATHMVLRSIIRSDQKSYPWFAPAGLRRGTVDNATAIGYIDGQTGEFQSIGVGNNLRDVLYNGKVNPISVLTGSGIVIYGQKTRSATTSSLDRVNVSRLVVYLRRQLDLIARQYIFEPNDDITRKEIKNQIEKELNSIKINRGLYDYAVVCDLSNNTPDRIDRNELWVDVAIEPVKAVEFVYIPVRIKNTGDIQAGL